MVRPRIAVWDSNHVFVTCDPMQFLRAGTGQIKLCPAAVKSCSFRLFFTAGKGIGYVLFCERAAVLGALALHGVKCAALNGGAGWQGARGAESESNGVSQSDSLFPRPPSLPKAV